MLVRNYEIEDSERLVRMANVLIASNQQANMTRKNT